nr:RHS repeat-associated core domain-containing protein [Pseudoalteromonas arctica]
MIARKEEGVSSHNINFEYNSLGQLIQQNLVSSENTKTTQYQWDSFGNPVSQSKIQNNELSEQQATQHNDNSDANDASNKVESNQSENTNNVLHSEYSDSKSATLSSELSEDDGVITGITDADRLTHFGDSDFHYDEFGNQIRETGKGIKTRREYNAFNQLSCFNNNGTLTQYDYDPLGRRIAKHTEQGKIDYIWDNDQLIGEYQHGEYTWYINLPNQFHPVALIKQGEVYYYHLDQLNTPRFVTNRKAEVIWENQADAYGYEESEVSTTNSFTQPIRFQGQYLDEESGLHYNRYRYYSPKQQRFINQDPIGLVGGINHYQYAPNPVNWVDPFGLLCKEGQAKVAAALTTAVNNGNITQALSDKIFANAMLPSNEFTADEIVANIPNAGETISERLVAGGKLSGHVEENVNDYYYNTGSNSYNLLEKNSKTKEIEVPAVEINKKDISIAVSDKLKALEKERKDAFAEKQAIDPNDEEALNAASQKMRDVSEKIGEESARLVMAKDYPDFEEISSQLPGEGKQGQFDLIYYNEKTGEVITVEAKGGGSILGSRKGLDGRQVQQGTPEYRDSIIENMKKQIEKAEDDDRYGNDEAFTEQVDDLAETLDKLEKAKKDERISSKKVSQKLHKDGSLAKTKTSDFSNIYTEAETE